MIKTNLATRPFYNERAVHLAILLLLIIVVLASVFNVTRVIQLSRSDTRLGTQASRDEASAAERRVAVPFVDLRPSTEAIRSALLSDVSEVLDTGNFVNGPAMTDAQLAGALEAGRQSVERALGCGAQLYVGGDMGIGNTTAAAALGCALLSVKPEALAGAGTGLDERGVAHKAAVIRRALEKHSGHLKTARDALRRVGGFEIAALVGAYVRCAQLGLPALIDGFICGAAALAASRLCPGAQAWWLFAHRSREPGHAAMLTALEARPLLDLGMRLGEGSGAAVAVPLLRLACELHAGMATFAEAKVSDRAG